MITDIYISDAGDITCDRDGLPVIITDLAVVQQDIKHAILESGLLTQLVAERSATMRKSVYNQLVLLVEADRRLFSKNKNNRNFFYKKHIPLPLTSVYNALRLLFCL